MRIVPLPSPNFNARPTGVAIDMLVLHYTGMPDAASALRALTDGAAPRQVSAHYTLDEDGAVYAHVDETMRAWHAGVSWWRGRADVNSRSIGIEIVNPGHEWGYRAFPEAQVAALTKLCRAIMTRHAIAPWGVVGHSDVAPARKTDPGELFPWARLAAEGIGTWPTPGAGVTPDDEVAAVLRRIGYGLAPETEASLAETIAAFQRRYRPGRIDGVADEETRRLMAALDAGGG